MFEAIHGSAPRLIEEGLSAYANPESILRATVMLLRHIYRTNQAEMLEKALNENTKIVAPDKVTAEEYVLELINLL
jgi:isocitrate dehydrogenase (NAD+)